MFAFKITHYLNALHERIDHLCLNAKTINCDIHPNNEINSTPNEVNSKSSRTA